MDISHKYSYITSTILITFLYIPLFPLGSIISFVGLIFGYFFEKLNFSCQYKRPEMLNQKICEFYLNYFRVFILDYAMVF